MYEAQVHLLNLSSLVTVSVALSRPRAAKTNLGKATNARQLGSYGNSLTGSEPGTEGRAQGSRDIIYGKRRKGRYGMVVCEWFDPTVASCHSRENIGGPALVRRAGFKSSRFF